MGAGLAEHPFIAFAIPKFDMNGMGGGAYAPPPMLFAAYAANNNYLPCICCLKHMSCAAYGAEYAPI